MSTVNASHDDNRGHAREGHWAGAKEFAGDLRALTSRDNHTNFRHIAFVWAVMIATIAATIWSYGYVDQHGLAWGWKVLATLVAVVVIGGSQHQLGGIVHEGCHYILFKNKKLNELASDWLAAFPLYTSTYAFRLHHLAHHQFINDAERDPNFKQAAESGHWLDFPITHIELLVEVLRMLNPLRGLTYILARVKYSSLGMGANPYAKEEKRGSPWINRVGALYALLTPFALAVLAHYQQWLAIALVITVPLVAIATYYARAPEDHFSESRLNPVIPARLTAISRIAFLALMYGAVCLAQYLTGAPALYYFGLLWLLPLFTTFPLFMVLREWVQHGNADRGRLTNSRVFLVDPISRYLVLPFGMDYHLPHHIFCSVPHYKLPDLHQLLLRDPEYAAKGMVVEGWLARAGGDKQHPTIAEVLGPEYAVAGNATYVDDDTLALADVNDRATLAEHSAKSRGVADDQEPPAASGSHRAA